MQLKMVIGIITVMVAVCLCSSRIQTRQSILTKKFSFFFKEVSLTEIIKSIDKQLNSVFAYSEEIIPKNVKLSIDEKNKTVDEILNKILMGTGIEYREFDEKIILTRKNQTKKEQATISGTVIDKSTGEYLIGANILIKNMYSDNQYNTGATTNQYGFYSITLDEGRYSLVCSYMGYEPEEINDIVLNRSMKLNIELKQTTVNLEEILVEDTEFEKSFSSVEIGINTIRPQKAELIPIIFGEQDILKTIQLMPGIISAGEGTSGFYVRGGGIDQNKILLDEATVYNPSHLFGFFSVFNSDAIKNVKIIKGNFPPEYGGRLSSVIDIKMNEGNNRRFRTSGGIGLIASRLTVEGPIVKEKCSFIITGRRTYADLIFPLGDSDTKIKKLYFYDLNTKVNYSFGNNDRIYLSGYFGRDVFDIKDQFGIDWGNITTTFRWNHIFGDKIFMNLTGIYSKYDYDFDLQDGDEEARVKSGINDINGKVDFQYYLDDQNTFKLGLHITKHLIAPGEISPLGKSNFNPKKIQEINSYESAAYLGHELKFSDRIRFNYGLRFSNYSIVGPGNKYYFYENGTAKEVEKIESGKLIKSYNRLEPRAALAYTPDASSSIKASYSRSYQYLHLLSNSTAGTPLVTWQSSTNNVKPGIADQYSIGYSREFDNNAYKLSIEAYYKYLQNQIDFKSGTEVLLNEYIEGELVSGRGWSYGIEFMLEKNIGNFTGWIGYALSKTERQFPDINDGKVFPAKQDRTHNISLVGIYNFNKDWSFSFNWVYNTGYAVTFPNGKYSIDGLTVNYYTQRNGYRMPDYHRLDAGITYNFSSSSRLTLSVYNVYGRRNAYAIDFREKENDPTRTEAVRYSLFSFVPSINYTFEF
ncbi:MAG: TonB-dependent receptor [Ignavibacteria bacterium]